MNYYQKSSINKKIRSLLFSTILVSTLPLYTNLSKAFEFQWNPNDGYKALRWYQTSSKKFFKNKILLFLRPNDRKTGLLSITIKFPKKFQSSLKI